MVEWEWGHIGVWKWGLGRGRIVYVWVGVSNWMGAGITLGAGVEVAVVGWPWVLLGADVWDGVGIGADWCCMPVCRHVLVACVSNVHFVMSGTV